MYINLTSYQRKHSASENAAISRIRQILASYATSKKFYFTNSRDSRSMNHRFKIYCLLNAQDRVSYTRSHISCLNADTITLRLWELFLAEQRLKKYDSKEDDLKLMVHLERLKSMSLTNHS